MFENNQGIISLVAYRGDYAFRREREADSKANMSALPARRPAADLDFTRASEARRSCCSVDRDPSVTSRLSAFRSAFRALSSAADVGSRLADNGGWRARWIASSNAVGRATIAAQTNASLDRS